jgi:hypothetical protein
MSRNYNCQVVWWTTPEEAGAREALLTDRGVSETPTAMRSGTALICPNAVVPDVSAAGAQGTID